MKKTKETRNHLIIIPARNEELTIASVVRDIAHAATVDIVVVDDCSSDHTIENAKKAGAIVLPLALQLGAWGAMQTGMRYAVKLGYQQIVTMDADGQHDSATINILLKCLNKDAADVAVAAYTQRGSWQRQFAWKLFRHLTGIKIEDLTSGYRAYNRKAFTFLASSETTLLDYQDIGVLLMLQRKQMSIVEVPTVMQPRIIGHSRIFSTWWVVAKYLAQSLLLSISRRNIYINLNSLCTMKYSGKK